MIRRRSTPRQFLWIWFLWLAAFYGAWGYLVSMDGRWAEACAHWPIAVAMAVGSYAAGSTPMGGGTVGFPLLALVLDQPAQLGRDFSFAVQSVGMVSASVLILARRQPLAWAMLKGALLGATLGTPLGILWIAPQASALMIKLVFAIVWGSFGLLHLWRLREIASHDGMMDFSEKWDGRLGFIIGFSACAGIVAVSGVGVDMALYAVLVLLCRADLKIAIPTSVIIMAYASVVGVVVKWVFTGLEPGVFANWLAAAPVVALGAPLGAVAVGYFGRKPTLLFVAALCVVQLVWTLAHEWNALGWRGLLGAGLGLGFCLLLFEWLRVWGGRLTLGRR